MRFPHAQRPAFETTYSSPHAVPLRSTPALCAPGALRTTRVPPPASSSSRSLSPRPASLSDPPPLLKINPRFTISILVPVTVNPMPPIQSSSLLSEHRSSSRRRGYARYYVLVLTRDASDTPLWWRSRYTGTTPCPTRSASQRPEATKGRWFVTMHAPGVEPGLSPCTTLAPFTLCVHLYVRSVQWCQFALSSKIITRSN
ncbi:hypothetical protein DFH09DRAFT_1152940 [Mycena vulgaris]|nr:hypothetical protein DFH09DRAFT_1152940 [Mycena vulgaris]